MGRQGRNEAWVNLPAQFPAGVYRVLLTRAGPTQLFQGGWTPNRLWLARGSAQIKGAGGLHAPSN